jgi:hypothetical protein
MIGLLSSGYRNGALYAAPLDVPSFGSALDFGLKERTRKLGLTNDIPKVPHRIVTRLKDMGSILRQFLTL